ncbi:MAG: histidinol phosphate phosphatase domain-containing protein [Deltaproteobacteria bacterium]|jgi:histidinol phosphatase-like PHP family hydrolase|nr:histidinol phosphate phosphatase domain-containing protein [Deltaproteobacteria bacterium]
MPLLNKVYDFHSHTFFSDGVLGPAELAQRARRNGYEVLGITDHADSSNLAHCVSGALRAAAALTEAYPGFTVLPGVELTHAPPRQLPDLIREARVLGAALVVVHGETPAEPVEPGTNLAALKGGCDILAHPGFISGHDAKLAAEKGIYLEISARAGHSLTNGFVANAARKAQAPLLVNSDAHAPEDLLTPEWQRKVALGAGLSDEEYLAAQANGRELFAKIRKGPN